MAGSGESEPQYGIRPVGREKNMRFFWFQRTNTRGTRAEILVITS